MKIPDLRKLSDIELTRYIHDISQRNNIICAKCGEILSSKERKCLNITINDRGYQRTKKLCNLCNECYVDMLDYIGINDIDWGENSVR